jgi:hypothetical protein
MQLNFEVNPGESASQNFLIGNSGCGTLNWTVTDNKSWITCDPTSGTNSGEVKVTVNSNGLPVGTYTGTVTVIDPNADNSPRTVNVTLTVGIPEIALSRTGLYFGASGGVQTGSQSFFVSNSGSGRLNWTVTDNAGWLNCTPASGTDSGVIDVSVNSSGLAPGTFTGTVYVNDPNAINSSQVLSVTLKVYMTGFTSNPFGTFETPITGTTVRSSIPVTGWVVEDIEVANVKIYNDSAYVGDAVFIEGARPDVEQSWPDWPKSYQAGWGYMLLTHFLSTEGDGTYTLYAKATDAEGHQVTLGSKTITVDNANAVKPFGAIDTPAQGGSASGSGFTNWGWALTPPPNCIPTNGSTITVYVDGVAVGNPMYNIYRDDIHQRFPNCLNSSGAMGRFSLDTTAYTNGVHTIAWSVTDDGGNSDGIGSRYFSVVNTGFGSMSLENGYIGHTNSRRWTRLSHLADIPVQTVTSLEYFRGYDRNREPEMASPDEYGVLNVQCRELERLEIRLAPPGGNLTGETYTGYHAVGSQLKSLPIGSYLGPHTGVFCWQPGTGFVGTYRLVFIRADGYGGGSRMDVVVTIAPRFR